MIHCSPMTRFALQDPNVYAGYAPQLMQYNPSFNGQPPPTQQQTSMVPAHQQQQPQLQQSAGMPLSSAPIAGGTLKKALVKKKVLAIVDPNDPTHTINQADIETAQKVNDEIAAEESGCAASLINQHV